MSSRETEQYSSVSGMFHNISMLEYFNVRDKGLERKTFVGIVVRIAPMIYSFKNILFNSGNSL